MAADLSSCSWAISSDLITVEKEKELGDLASIEYFATNYYGVKVEDIFGSYDTEEFIQLINKIQRYVHPNILPFMGVVVEENQAKWILYEKLNHTLQTTLENNEEQKTISEILILSKDICRGLLYLHSQKVVYGNLKPVNILIGRGDIVKLFNVGMDTNQKIDENEIRKDIYDFGVLLVQIILHSPNDSIIATDVRSAIQKYPCFSKILSETLSERLTTKQKHYTSKDLFQDLNDLSSMIHSTTKETDLVFLPLQTEEEEETEAEAGTEDIQSQSTQIQSSPSPKSQPASPVSSPIPLTQPQQQQTPSKQQQSQEKAKPIQTNVPENQPNTNKTNVPANQERTPSATKPNVPVKLPQSLPKPATTKKQTHKRQPTTPQAVSIPIIPNLPEKPTTTPKHTATPTNTSIQANNAPSSSINNENGQVKPTGAPLTSVDQQKTPTPVQPSAPTKPNFDVIVLEDSSPTHDSTTEENQNQETLPTPTNIQDATGKEQFIAALEKLKTDPQKALELIEPVKDTSYGLLFRGFLHITGYGIKKQNYSFAVKCFKLASEQGCEVARAMYAYLLFRGFGVDEPDEKLAKQEASTALKQLKHSVNPIREFGAALLIAHGIGCEISLPFSIRYFTQHIQQFHFYLANVYLAIIFLKDTPHQDIKRAVLLIKDAGNEIIFFFSFVYLLIFNFSFSCSWHY